MTDGSGESGRRSVLRGRQGVGWTGARFARNADVGPSPDDVVASGPEVPLLPDRTSSDPLVGRTGARFGSRARRARRERAAAPLALPPGPSAAAPLALPAVSSGSRPLPSPWPDRTPAQAPPVVRHVEISRDGEIDRGGQLGRDAVIPAARAPWSGPVVGPLRSDDDAPTTPLHLAELRSRIEGIEPRVSVRPYVRTRGRTHARSDLRVETLVSIPSPRRPVEDPEHRVITELCDGPRSVAEVAALMRVPLGVARILIGDMADDGTLTVHRPLDRLGPDSGPDHAMMARVLRGLRAL